MYDSCDDIAPKEASLVTKAICDHVDEDGGRITYCPNENESIDNRGRIRQYYALEENKWGNATASDQHFCPKHKKLHCVDNDEVGHGCGEVLNNYGKCDNCEATEEEIEKEYADSWGFNKKASFIPRVRCNHYGDNGYCQNEIVVDRSGILSGYGAQGNWGVANVSGSNFKHNDFATEHFCPEHKDLHCVDDANHHLTTTKNGCGSLLGPYGKCTWCSNQTEDGLVKEYADAWGFNKKASTFFHCDEEGCNNIVYHDDYETLGDWLSGEQDYDFCPEHKKLHCVDRDEIGHGCGELLNKYSLCDDCEATEEDTEENYKNAWGFDKKASENSFVCDKCCYDHHIKNMNKYGDCVYCKDCYDQIKKEVKKDYKDAWGFNKDSSMHSTGEIDCDHPLCNKIVDLEDAIDKNWQTAGQTAGGEKDIADFCPEHAQLYCIDQWDEEGRNLLKTGCGKKLNKKNAGIFGQCLDCDGKDSKAYFNAWGFDKKASSHNPDLLCFLSDGGVKCPSCIQKSFPGKDIEHDKLVDEYGTTLQPIYPWDVHGYHDSLYCDNCSEYILGEDTCGHCEDTHPGPNMHWDDKHDCYICPPCAGDTTFCPRCKSWKEGKYGQCETCDGSNEEYQKDYKDAWGFDKKASTFHHCDEEGCKNIVYHDDEDALENWFLGKQDSDYCPEHAKERCPNCTNLKGKYGQCLVCDGLDENIKKNYDNAWGLKKAINYFSLDQPNEAIMPGMAQDTGDTDGLGFGSTPNPDPGKDGMATDAPSMQDYERGLSSAASKEAFIKIFCDSCYSEIPRYEGYDPGNGSHYCNECSIKQPEVYNDAWGFDKKASFERVIFCDRCGEHDPNFDQYINSKWGRASLNGFKDKTPGLDYDDSEELHFCPTCKKGRHLDENINDPLNMTFGCGQKLGKFGQCTLCEGSDKKFYNSAWGFGKKSNADLTNRSIQCGNHKTGDDEICHNSFQIGLRERPVQKAIENGWTIQNQQFVCPKHTDINRCNKCGWKIENSSTICPHCDFVTHNYNKAWGFDKKATMTYGADCDHPGCNEHEDGLDYDMDHPIGWETVHYQNGDPDSLSHVCPLHKNLYCTDQYQQRLYAKFNNKEYNDCYGYAEDGCGSKLDKDKGRCLNCEPLTKEEKKQDYNKAWGFDKNSSVRQAMWDDDNYRFRCDECLDVGGVDGDEKNAAKKGWKFGYGLIYCPECWKDEICHNCWSPKLDTLYNQCKYCEGDDQEHKKKYNDAWGF